MPAPVCVHSCVELLHLISQPIPAVETRISQAVTEPAAQLSREKLGCLNCFFNEYLVNIFLPFCWILFSFSVESFLYFEC